MGVSKGVAVGRPPNRVEENQGEGGGRSVKSYDTGDLISDGESGDVAPIPREEMGKLAGRPLDDMEADTVMVLVNWLHQKRTRSGRRRRAAAAAGAGPDDGRRQPAKLLWGRRYELGSPSTATGPNGSRKNVSKGRNRPVISSKRCSRLGQGSAVGGSPSPDGEDTKDDEGWCTCGTNVSGRPPVDFNQVSQYPSVPSLRIITKLSGQAGVRKRNDLQRPDGCAAHAEAPGPVPSTLRAKSAGGTHEDPQLAGAGLGIVEPEKPPAGRAAAAAVENKLAAKGDAAGRAAGCHRARPAVASAARTPAARERNRQAAISEDRDPLKGGGHAAAHTYRPSGPILLSENPRPAVAADNHHRQEQHKQQQQQRQQYSVQHIPPPASSAGNQFLTSSCGAGSVLRLGSQGYQVFQQDTQLGQHPFGQQALQSQQIFQVAQQRTKVGQQGLQVCPPFHVGQHDIQVAAVLANASSGMQTGGGVIMNLQGSGPAVLASEMTALSYGTGGGLETTAAGGSVISMPIIYQPFVSSFNSAISAAPVGYMLCAVDNGGISAGIAAAGDAVSACVLPANSVVSPSPARPDAGGIVPEKDGRRGAKKLGSADQREAGCRLPALTPMPSVAQLMTGTSEAAAAASPAYSRAFAKRQSRGKGGKAQERGEQHAVPI